MQTPYSTIAIKYVGSTRAQEAVDALRGLQRDGSVSLKGALAVTRSDNGELSYFPDVSDAAQQAGMRMGAAGFLLGLVLGRRMRWSLVGAGLGAAVGWFSVWLQQQDLAATLPTLEKNESMLYARIGDADWTEFEKQMRPYLVQGLPVVQNLAAEHEELAELLSPPTEMQVPRTDEFPEPPGGGTPVPVARDAEPDIVEPAARGSETAGPENAEPDDFSDIKGIGPVIRRRLREAGIESFAQLAEMDVEELAETAGVPEGRIASDDWIGQAKSLAAPD